MSIDVTADTWEQEVLAASGVVLVDLDRPDWASSAGFSLVLTALVDAWPGLVVRRLDVTAAPAVARRYGVTSVPTLLVFVDGVLRHRLVGTRQPDQLRRELAALLDPYPPSVASSAVSRSHDHEL
ncbi:thioredoxin family protein [Egicoccus sp. AB-alg2]|uniref:thioredoxin family protein n=1 Tax=Egicoccus sp. AB-alg2 TaxID=3242693 RepID=UPI00359E6F88